MPDPEKVTFEEAIEALRVEACNQSDGYLELYAEVAIVREAHQREVAEARDGRLSLAQEIREGLSVRGYWVPKEIDTPDLIMAVAQALDSFDKKIAEAEARVWREAATLARDNAPSCCGEGPCYCDKGLMMEDELLAAGRRAAERRAAGGKP